MAGWKKGAFDPVRILPVRPGYALIIIALLLLLLLPAACRKKGPEKGEAASEAVNRGFVQGPLTVNLRLNAGRISVADRLNLVIEAQAPEDIEVQFPDFKDRLGEFSVISRQDQQPELTAAGKLVRRRTLVLEPFLAGDYKIPVLTFGFREKGDASGKDRELLTTEIPVTVTSVLLDDTGETEIKDIYPPMKQPLSRSLFYWGAAAVLILLTAVFFLIRHLWRRKTRNVPPPPEPAHVLAFRALERLLAGNLLVRGEIKQFYVRLSDILRRYIENRFGLRAPERTTEEFLNDLRGNEALETRHKTLLKEFLTQCDLVKFARHHPLKDDIDGLVELSRQFIRETGEEGKTEGGTVNDKVTK